MDLYTFISELTRCGIYFRMNSYRDGYVAVEVPVPGERWEIEFAQNGEIEVEVFRSDGAILDGGSLNVLLERFSERCK